MKRRRGKDCPQWSHERFQSDTNPSPRGEWWKRPGRKPRNWPQARGGELETILMEMLQCQRQQGERMGSNSEELHKVREADQSRNGRQIHCQ